MDIREVLRRYWWVIALILVAVGVLASRRPDPLGAELAQPTPEGTLEDSLVGVQRELEEASMRRAISEERLARQMIEAQGALFAEQAKLEQTIARRMAEKAAKVPIRCPRGKTRLDPQTGQLFCRVEEHRGFFRETLLPSLYRVAGSWLPRPRPRVSLYGD